MAFLQFFLFATAAALDVLVTCDSAPKYYTIDGMANRQLSIHAGESISFNFDAGCSGYPMQIMRIDGTPIATNANSLSTSASTPECLIYAATSQPSTMTGTISVIGGSPCGATLSASVSLYNRPVVSPLPATTTLYPAPLYPATPLYNLPTNIYASGSISLYSGAVCPARACPALFQCVLPAYQQRDTMADGCPGCPYCFTPRTVPLPTPCVGLYCLPCCPTMIAGQACRNCLSFY